MSSPALPSPSQFSALPHNRDITPSSPPSSHDRFLNSSNGYSRRKRPSTSSTDSLEISMGFKRLLAKPADPPQRHKSASTGVNQSRNNKSLSDSEGLVNGNKRIHRLPMGMTSDTETQPRPIMPAVNTVDQDHHRTQHQPSNISSSQRLARHSSKSPNPSQTPSLDQQLHANLSEPSTKAMPKTDTHTPSKPRNVLRRKNSTRDPLSTPTFEIVTPPPPKRKPVPTVQVEKLTPAGAVAYAYMSQEKRREELAQSARSSSPPTVHHREQTLPQQPLLEPKGGQLIAVGHPEDSLSSHSSPKTPLSGPRHHTSLPLPIPSHNHSLPSLNSSTSCCMYTSSSPSVPKEKVLNRKRSLGLFSSGDRKDTPRPAPNTFSSFSKGHGNHGNTNEFGQSLRVNQTSSPINMESPGNNGSPGGGGNKLWKLMKRISTGGLREKFVAQEAPPVPALPLHLSVSQKSDVVSPSSSDNGHSNKKNSSSKTSKPHPNATTIMTSSISGPSIQQVESPGVMDELNPRSSLAELISLPYGARHSTSAPPPRLHERSPAPSPRPSASSSPNISNAYRRPAVSPLERVKTAPSQTTLTSMDSGVFSAEDGEQLGDPIKNAGKQELILGKHILSPSELMARMGPDGPPLFGSYSAPSSPPHSAQKHEDKGLPIPPRGRPFGSPEKSPKRLAEDSFLIFDGRESPDFPSFSIENAVNTFGPRSRPNQLARLSRSNSTSIPNTDKPLEVLDNPIPKSLKRRPSLKDIILPRGDDLVPKKEKLKRPSTADMASTSGRAPARPSRHPSRPPPPTRGDDDKLRSPHTPRSTRVSDEFHALAHLAGTRERPRSSSFSGIPSPGKASPHRSTSHHATPSRATFRELSTKEAPKQLSEAEKARRWEELLARSERAGGTLHLAGVDRLESDHM